MVRLNSDQLVDLYYPRGRHCGGSAIGPGAMILLPVIKLYRDII